MNEGWRPLKPPSRPRTNPERVKIEGGTFVVAPFVRLARVHALAAAGDAMIAVALAGSLFFSIDPSAARQKVALYLLFTMAPFALVSKYIGPAIDRARGGRRAMVVVINLLRALTALAMVGNLDSLFLFPLAFAQLVLQKGYAVAKAAVVPTVVRSADELVDRNARLALLGGVAGFAGVLPAVLGQVIAGAPLVVVLAALTYGAAFVASFALPRAAAAEQEGDVERAELRSTPILSAASSMGLLRGIMGFFSFLVAFAFRGGTDGNDLSGVGSQVGAEMRALLLDRDLSTGSVSAARLGLVVGAVVLGQLVASVVASRSRDLVGEQRMIDIALIGTAAVALLCTWVGGLSGAVVLGFVVGVSVNGAKLAFDTIVQQNAPDANYGRSFARFETRFQVIWVLGALVPVVFPIPARIGFFIVFAAATLAAFSYRLGRRADHAGPVRVAPPAVQPLEPVPTVPAERADVDPTTVRPPDPAYDDTRRLPANPPPATNPVDQLPLWDDHR